MPGAAAARAAARAAAPRRRHGGSRGGAAAARAAAPLNPKLRIQGRMQIFEKMSQMALNRVLTVPDCRSGSKLPESGLRSQKGPLGAEL